MLICHAIIGGITLLIFFSTLSLDPKKSNLIMRYMWRRNLAKLKSRIKRQKSLEIMSIGMPNASPSSPGIY